MKLFISLIAFLFVIPICHTEEPPKPITIKKKIKLIVIDPGFGGNKSGPSGCEDKVLAKDINLEIAKKVAGKIRKNLDVDVLMTRKNDVNLSPEERANFANLKKADLFISIHTNGSNLTSANGIETYCLKIFPEPDAIRIAAREKASSPENIEQLESILSDLMQHVEFQAKQSELLAKNIQSHLYNRLKSKHNHIKNRGVKQAPFYVLLGTAMPSIMVQAGFITNPNECSLLRSEAYQKDISDGIVAGIKAFLKER